MITYIGKQKKHPIYRMISGLVAVAFIFSTVMPPTYIFAQVVPATVLNLPVPGTMVPLSIGFNPPMVNGITIYPNDPFKFDFLVGHGDHQLEGEAFEAEAKKLIKYFLASLTVPEEELWVNLSPYEEDRIIPESLSKTEMGRDLLTQDYMLKQLTASLMYPENELGERFWNRIREKVEKEYGTYDLPVDTFNKVWIVPQDASIYETENTAIVIDSYLKVMLENDYMALQHSKAKSGDFSLGEASPHADIIKEVIIPEIEKEINEGETFANLRQIYNSMILATWYKKNLRESLLGQVYIDQNKVRGIDTVSSDMKDKIYKQYLEAFNVGVYNYIREEIDPNTQEIIPRKYFAGGSSPVLFENIVGAPVNRTTQRLAAIHTRDSERIVTVLRDERIAASPISSGDTERLKQFMHSIHQYENGSLEFADEYGADELGSTLTQFTAVFIDFLTLIPGSGSSGFVGMNEAQKKLIEESFWRQFEASEVLREYGIHVIDRYFDDPLDFDTQTMLVRVLGRFISRDAAVAHYMESFSMGDFVNIDAISAAREALENRDQPDEKAPTQDESAQKFIENIEPGIAAGSPVMSLKEAFGHVQGVIATPNSVDSGTLKRAIAVLEDQYGSDIELVKQGKRQLSGESISSPVEWVEEIVRRIAIKKLGVDADKIGNETLWVSDLDADSNGFDELITAIELEFNVEIKVMDIKNEGIRSAQSAAQFLSGATSRDGLPVLIEYETRRAIAESFGVEIFLVMPGSRFVEELVADGLGADLISDLSERLKIHITDGYAERMASVEDVVQYTLTYRSLVDNIAKEYDVKPEDVTPNRSFEDLYRMAMVYRMAKEPGVKPVEISHAATFRRALKIKGSKIWAGIRRLGYRALPVTPDDQSIENAQRAELSKLWNVIIYTRNRFLALIPDSKLFKFDSLRDILDYLPTAIRDAESLLTYGERTTIIDAIAKQFGVDRADITPVRSFEDLQRVATEREIDGRRQLVEALQPDTERRTTLAKSMQVASIGDKIRYETFNLVYGLEKQLGVRVRRDNRTAVINSMQDIVRGIIRDRIQASKKVEVVRTAEELEIKVAELVFSDIEILSGAYDLAFKTKEIRIFVENHVERLAKEGVKVIKHSAMEVVTSDRLRQWMMMGISLKRIGDRIVLTRRIYLEVGQNPTVIVFNIQLEGELAETLVGDAAASPVRDESVSSPVRLNPKDREVLIVTFGLQLDREIRQAFDESDMDELTRIVNGGITEVFGDPQVLPGLVEHLVGSLMEGNSVRAAIDSYGDASSPLTASEKATRQERLLTEMMGHPIPSVKRLQAPWE